MSIGAGELPITLLGLPEDDGSFPFFVAAWGPVDALVIAGRAAGGVGGVDCEAGTMAPDAARALAQRMVAEHGFVSVPPYAALSLLERAFDAGERPEGWALLDDLVDAGTRNSARLLDPLRGLARELDPAQVARAEPLVHPKNGLFLALDEAVVNPAFDRIFAALSTAGDDEARRERLARVIDETADLALSGTARSTWALALDVLTFLAQHQGWEPVREAARHTALAVQAGWPGSRIPWVRIWTERQLAQATEQMLGMMRGRQDR